MTAGRSKIHPKLQRLGELNEIMAFRPWTLTTSHVEFLNKNNEQDQSLNWSLPQIIQAGAILATYHSLCGLIFGQGIKEDIDIEMNFDKALKCDQESMQEFSTQEVSDSNYLSELEEKTINYLKGEHNEEEDQELPNSEGEELEGDLDKMQSLNIDSDKEPEGLESVKEVEEENKGDQDEQAKRKTIFEKHRLNKY